jgi:hypothetical protein
LQQNGGGIRHVPDAAAAVLPISAPFLDGVVSVRLRFRVQVTAVAACRGEPTHLLSGVGLARCKTAVRDVLLFSLGLWCHILPQVLVGRNLLGNIFISHPNSQASAAGYLQGSARRSKNRGLLSPGVEESFQAVFAQG